MPTVKDPKDLPEGVREFSSSAKGIAYGDDYEKEMKRKRSEEAKKELAELDTVGSKVKAVTEDVVKGVGKLMPGYGSLSSFRDREFGAATKERNRKIEEAKKEIPEPVKKAKGGSVKSASARADGCAIRGKTRA
jgi:hypothetical protein